MKHYFVKRFRGYQFEFTRDLHSSPDTWYDISVIADNRQIKYRMHKNSESLWKITTQRLPPWLYSLETEFNDAIQINENPHPAIN